MKHFLYLILMLSFSTILMSAEMRFDQHGKMLQPDQTYLNQGLTDQQEGYPNDAMRNLKKAAKFGNPYAQSAIAFIHMKNDDYISALAWFSLVDLKMVDKDEVIIKLMDELTAELSPVEQQQSQQMYENLVSQYGKAAAMEHRLQWQKNISISGTKLKGNVPGRVKIYPTARIEKNGLETEIFVSSTMVSGVSVKRQMEAFVFDYELKFTHGNVRMKDVEIINENQPI